MTTSKPVELGRVSDETKDGGPSASDGPGSISGPLTA
jgi:hypothetical protein